MIKVDKGDRWDRKATRGGRDCGWWRERGERGPD
jgi:hypothetical protein